jgi:GT2 family glycosyltransferase
MAVLKKRQVSMDKVYIVLVNHNNYSDTIECLESLLKSTYLNFQIFLIDNSANDESINNFSTWVTDGNYRGIHTNFEYLVFPATQKPIDHIIINESDFNQSKELFEEKIIIIRATNNGFAAANNIALRYILKNGTDDSFIWILNNDTVVEKETLTNLMAFYKAGSDIRSLIGSKLKYYYNPDILQAIAGKYNTWIGKHYHIGDGQKDLGQFDNYKLGRYDYIIGATIFLPKLFIKTAGLMCEDYFLYFEELDWMQMAHKYGFKITVAPNAIVYHKEGSSITVNNGKQRDTFNAEYYSITNRVKFIKKWYPFRLFTVLPGVAFAILKRLLKGKLKLVYKTSASIFKILITK